MDAGIYFTKNVRGGNYGAWGGQIQYIVLNDLEDNVAVSVRGNFVSLFGPDDLGLTVFGLDLLASKEYSVWSDWVSVSSYAGISAYMLNAHETSAVVDLDDERVLGMQAMVGAVAQISLARIGVECNVASVNSVSFKLGVAF